jgi:plastocyanin
MFKRQSVLAAATALLLGCGIEIDLENPSPPGAAAGGAAADTGVGGATSASGATPGDTATPPGDTATPPGTTPPGTATPPGTTPPGPTAPGAPAAVTHTVKLLNMQYSEATTTIKVGDTVVWQNVDSMDHTTTSDTGVWNSPLAQGASFKFTFTSAGSFPYYCAKHKSSMKGTVVVQP